MLLRGCLSRFLRGCEISSLAKLKRRPILATCVWKRSAEKINCMFAKQIIDNASLFDDHVVVKNYNSASERREIWQNTPISYEQKWTQLFQAFKDKDIPIPNFQKLVEFVFCLPGTLAPVKRIFFNYEKYVV